MKIGAVTCAGFLLVAPAAAQAGKLTTLYNIPGYNDGAMPLAALLDFKGAFWGTTSGGGLNDAGTVFKIDPASGAETLVYQFTGGTDGSGPAAPLIAVDGTLYGTTQQGGANNEGAVFKIDPATGAETVVYSFPFADEGANPVTALLVYHGLLYGVATLSGANGFGFVYAVDPSTGSETTVYSFQGGNDGTYPTAPLVKCGDALCGTTPSGGTFNGGTLYRIDPATGAETVLHSFGSFDDASFISGPVIDVGGVLYGTGGGGALSDGAIFAFDLKTQVESVIYNFTGGANGGGPGPGLLSANGLLYGTAGGGSGNSGIVFAVDPSSGSETTLYSFNGTDGATPLAGLITAGGTLYGTTAYGGPTDNGVVFAVDPATGRGTTLHAFEGTEIGQAANVIRVGGTLYGTASGGGDVGLGSIFKVDPKTGAGKTLYSFVGGSDGQYPFAALLEAGGTLYGTTRNGGASNQGTIFGFDPVTRRETTLYSFTGQGDGGYIFGGLIDVAGVLYGTAYDGGATGNGTVFSFDLATGTETTLYAFAGGQDGSLPYSGVIYANGMLYGTTLSGGTRNAGTVFQVNLATGAEAVLYEFKGGADGSDPVAGLLYDHGMLYGGTAGFGGKLAKGTLFKIDAASGRETVLHHFAIIDGPQASLIRKGDALYGTTTEGGKFGYGIVFSLNPATGAVAPLYNFTGGTDGGLPSAPLVEQGGTLYGTTPSLVPTNAGTVFRLGH